ncbi:hypothetical protein ACFL1A_01285 [Patescibacteria group bacterium]
MEKLKAIITKKPTLFIVTSLVYLVFIALLKWEINFVSNSALFMIGGIIGVYFIDIAEDFFCLDPSPFRSIVFCAGFVAVSIFVVTSSGAPLAIGLVLSMYLNMIMKLWGQWKLTGNLKDWYTMVAEPVSRKTQIYSLIGFIGIFLIETLVYIR